MELTEEAVQRMTADELRSALQKYRDPSAIGPINQYTRPTYEKVLLIAAGVIKNDGDSDKDPMDDLPDVDDIVVPEFSSDESDVDLVDLLPAMEPKRGIKRRARWFQTGDDDIPEIYRGSGDADLGGAKLSDFEEDYEEDYEAEDEHDPPNVTLLRSESAENLMEQEEKQGFPVFPAIAFGVVAFAAAYYYVFFAM